MRDAADLLSVLSRASQDNRLLRMDFPRDDGPPGAILLVNTMTANEAVSRGFYIEAELLSDDAAIPLTAMMARMVTISMVRDDGELRYFNGYVTRFRFVRTDGGFAVYNMVLEPWMTFTKLGQDCRTFLGKTTIDLTKASLENYLQSDWRHFLIDEDPVLTCANQYNESDHNHLHRRWEALGLHYWYEHRKDGHTLCLADNSRMAKLIDGEQIIFRSESGAGEEDGLSDFQSLRSLASGAVTLSSFNYKNPFSHRAQIRSMNEQGDVFPFEVHEDTGSYGFKDTRDGDALVQQRIEEIDAHAELFEASGNARTAFAGHGFSLDGHFALNGDYFILSVSHSASNNYHLKDKSTSHYANHFSCVPASKRWRPGRYFNSHPCPMPGIQTAIVVGPEGEDIHTDALGRVKIQFHWDRRGNNDESSSAWVRVMLPWAGQQFGHVNLPRIGDEVLVQFLDNNIDHPIITGMVFNSNNMPPWDLPGQKALSGVRSRELSGGTKSNHLVLDDSQEQVQAQLRSDHQHSQLSLGRITRIDSTAGRQDARGEGWELATDAWGALRAGRGMLLSTESRPNLAAHTKSMDETIARLQDATSLHAARVNKAVQFQAQEGADQQTATVKALERQQTEVAGSATEELSEPHLVLTSPAGIIASSAGSMHFASAEHTAISSGRSLSIATGGSVFASIRDTFRLFVHKAGMKLVAASGNVVIHAKTDDIEMVAQKVLKLISQTDWVDICGRKGVRLHGANSMIEISDKVQVFTKSPTLFHGNLETLASGDSPQSGEDEPSKPDKGELHMTLQSHVKRGKTYANHPYSVLKDGATIKASLTDQYGRMTFPHDEGTSAYTASLMGGEDVGLVVKKQLPQDEIHALSNAGARALENTPASRSRE